MRKKWVPSFVSGGVCIRDPKLKHKNSEIMVPGILVAEAAQSTVQQRPIGLQCQEVLLAELGPSGTSCLYVGTYTQATA